MTKKILTEQNQEKVALSQKQFDDIKKSLSSKVETTLLEVMKN